LAVGPHRPKSVLIEGRSHQSIKLLESSIKPDIGCCGTRVILGQWSLMPNAKDGTQLTVITCIQGTGAQQKSNTPPPIKNFMPYAPMNCLAGPLKYTAFTFRLHELVFRDTGDYLMKVQSWTRRTRGMYRVDGWQRRQPYWKSVLMPRLSVNSVRMASWLQGRLRVSSNRRSPWYGRR
jgi:hypothetical protein